MMFGPFSKRDAEMEMPFPRTSRSARMPAPRSSQRLRWTFPQSGRAGACHRFLRAIGFLALLFVTGLPVCGAEQKDAADPSVFFRKQVEPILVRRCLECHGSDRKGELDLRTKAAALKGGESGKAIVPGKPEESLLFDYISSEEMPPEKPLSETERSVLRRWIERGAWFPDEPLDPFTATTEKWAGYDWWSLRPLATDAPPMPENIPDAWKYNPIDCFVFEKLAERGLAPNPPAEPAVLIRRLFFDLTGLPPTPEELETWSKRLAADSDQAEQAYEELVDRLLASPRYGEQWGRHWLDVIRFGESTGFERNVIINNAWPFRDYVIRSINEDKPFDRLVLEHLAGDLIAEGDPDVAVGTTFLVCGPYDNVGNQDPVQAAQIRANTIDEIIRATGETFLGMTVGCGRCHNHKFDPITQHDYYSMYATFAGVFHGSREISTPDQRHERNQQLKPLQEKRERLTQEKTNLEKAIAARAEQNAAEQEARWLRPQPKRTGTTETFPPQQVRFVRLTCEGLDTNPHARTGFRIDEFEVWTAEAEPRNAALARHGGQARGNSRVAQDFADAYSPMLTIDGEFGASWIAAGPTLTIELARPETVDRVIFSSDRSGAAGTHSVATFIAEYRIEVSLDGNQWTPVASSYDRKPVSAAHRKKRLFDAAVTQEERKELQHLEAELDQVNSQIASIPPLPSWWVGNFRDVKGPFHVFLGGSPQRKGDAVVPASLTMLDKVSQPYRLTAEAPEGERRLALARWIVAEDNPLTPRVLVNRLWHYHFGTGIVDTPSDFGFMGGRPTHPELLDWLARQVHQHGWKLKPVHKQIVMSQTYRQASTFRSDAAQIDADSRLLWRFPPRRLSAEEIRDSMLAIAGKLDLHMGGPGFRLYRYLQDNVATYVPLDEHGPETYRRAVYHQNARASRIDLMTDFDSPDCAFATPRRTSTTTPLQALTMMNHQFTLDMASAMAERLKDEASSTADDPLPGQIERAFLLCFGRVPNPDERTACRKLALQYGLPALCRVLLNSNELIFIE